MEVLWTPVEVAIWEDLEFLASGASLLGIWGHLGFPSLTLGMGVLSAHPGPHWCLLHIAHPDLKHLGIP